jgi:hypothetical protein
MAFSYSDPAVGLSEPPGDFNKNYKYLKRLINKALREGTPLEDLHLIEKQPPQRKTRQLSRKDLLRILSTIRRIKNRYQELLESPVPHELERDILAKSPEERLPWEEEALEKADKWRAEVEAVRLQVRRELNEHLEKQLFKDL